jgi:hypothetical protein
MSWKDKGWRKNPRTKNKPCVKCGGWVTVVGRGNKMVRQCQAEGCRHEEDDN